MAVNPVQSSVAAGFEPVFAMTPQRSPAYLRMRDEVANDSRKVGPNGSGVVMGIAGRISNAYADGEITRKEAQTLLRLAQKTIDRESRYEGDAAPAMIAGLNNIANTKSTWPLPSPSDARRDAARELLQDVFPAKSK